MSLRGVPRSRWFGAAVVALAAAITLAGLGAPAAQAISVFPGENVTVSAGTLQGVVKSDHREFLGVPFAAPPTGSRRFAAPAPPASWSGERAARSKGGACPQSFPVIGSLYPSGEDCLYLDVYTPPATAPASVTKKTPVMVWFYGGGYAIGSTGQYDPTPLVTRGGVIVVQVNYRVGPFGFLALPGLAGPDGAAGNYGLLDQQAGLRWVQQNIGAFGGDASNVTVFGESAGGNSVCQQLISPTAGGLFQRAIVQSGGCAGTTLLNGVPRTAAYAAGTRFAQDAGCTDAASMVSCLRGKPVPELLKPDSVQFRSMRLTFVPTVDGVTVPGSPVQAFAAGAYAKVPILIGGQLDEGRLFVFLFHHLSRLARVTPAQYEAAVREIFGARTPAVLARYPASAYARISAESATDLALAQVWTDGLFACSMLSSVQALQRNRGQAVYAYEFTDPAPPLAGADPFMPMGDFHGSDLFYLMARNSDIPVIYLDPAQRALSDRMISYWTTFARTGDPNPPGSSAWPRYSGPAPALMPLSSATATPFPVTSFATAHQCSFWNGR